MAWPTWKLHHCAVSNEFGPLNLLNSSLAGAYTLVVSAFEPGATGDYILKIESTSTIVVSPIAPEGAGMYVRTVEGVW